MSLAETKFTRAAVTLAEIVMVVAIIVFLAALAVPGFLRARKRSHAAQLVHNLHLLGATPARPA